MSLSKLLNRIAESVRFRVSHKRSQFDRFNFLRKVLGLTHALRYLRGESIARSGTGPSILLTTKLAAYPLLVRPGSSDIEVFRQIFVETEYGPLPDLPLNAVIVDAGANVGYSSAYLLTRFPTARVIAIEPDSSNLICLRENLKQFGPRAKVVPAALWSSQTELSFTSVPYRDGREWARQVTALPKLAQSIKCSAISMSSLMHDYQIGRIDLMKVDIEGAEGEVFANEFQSWLPLVNNIVIELHRDSSFGDCAEIFHKAVTDAEFTKETSGEVLICRRKTIPLVVANEH